MKLIRILGVVSFVLAVTTAVYRHFGIGDPEPSVAARIIADSLSKYAAGSKPATFNFEWSAPEQVKGTLCVEKLLRTAGFEVTVSEDGYRSASGSSLLMRGSLTGQITELQLQLLIARVDRCTRNQGAVAWKAAWASSQ